MCHTKEDSNDAALYVYIGATTSLPMCHSKEDSSDAALFSLEPPSGFFMPLLHPLSYQQRSVSECPFPFLERACVRILLAFFRRAYPTLGLLVLTTQEQS